MLHHDLTSSCISAFYEVHRELGHGFLESVYEHAMLIALSKRGLVVERQVSVNVFFRGRTVGEFFADLLIEEQVIVELKACRALAPSHEAQLLNYLRAAAIEVGLLLHFAPKPVFRRLILTNDCKPYYSLRSLPRLSCRETAVNRGESEAVDQNLD